MLDIGTVYILLSYYEHFIRNIPNTSARLHPWITEFRAGILPHVHFALIFHSSF